jgi:hypothetical protein
MAIDVTRTASVTVSVSAFDLGREFARMNSEDQAQFFNGIAEGIRHFEKPACFQWQYMRDDMEGLPKALKVFRDMMEYAA